jgi:NADH-quinone oxidoreductase subunit N
MIAELLLLYPELILLTAICVVLIADMLFGKNLPSACYFLSFIFLTYTSFYLAHRTPDGLVTTLFYDSLTITPYTQTMKFIATVFMMVILTQAKFYLSSIKKIGCEFFVLSLINLLGIFIMVSAANFLVLYLGLELVALTLYTLVAFDRDSNEASEAAMKFYVLGSVASGFLLYGISLIYGATGSINLETVSSFYLSNPVPEILSIVGLMFILVSVIFKFGGFPLFQWVPDTYEGAMLPVGMILASVSKIASFVFFALLLHTVFIGLESYWSIVITIIGVASLVYGNLVALRQNNIKRLVGYSTIGHVGFILIALSIEQAIGFNDALFYTVTYALMAFSFFAILISLHVQGVKVNSVNDLKGLHHSQPVLALMMLICIFSMAGIPPFIGFHAKLFVIQALLETDHLYIALTCVITSLVAAYYYLKIIWFIYFEPTKHLVKGSNSPANILAIISALSLLVIGFFPDAWSQFLLSINP